MTTFFYRVFAPETGQWTVISLDAANEQTVHSWLLRQYGAGNVISANQSERAGATHIGSLDSNGVFTPAGGTVTPSPDIPATGVYQTELGPYTQYLAQIGRGAAEYGPAAGYERSLYDPLRSLWDLETLLEPVTTTQRGITAGPGDWSDYLGRGYAGVSGQAAMGTRAAQLLKQQMQLTPAERSAYNVSWAPRFDDITGEATRDVSQQHQQALLRLGLRGAGWSGLGARRFAQRLPQEEDIWLQEQAAGSQEGFLDYIARKYNMVGYLPSG